MTLEQMEAMQRGFMDEMILLEQNNRTHKLVLNHETKKVDIVRVWTSDEAEKRFDELAKQYIDLGKKILSEMGVKGDEIAGLL